MQYKKRLIFWASCAGILMFGISVLTLGSIAPDLRLKLGLDERSAGTLFSVLPAGMLTGSLIFGPVADRFGYRILLASACFSLFAGFEGIAIVSSKTLINLFVFIAGTAGGAINGSTSALVADISDDKKGADLSLLGSFFCIGAFGMPLLLGLLKPWFSFEALLTIVGILTMLTGILFLSIKFPPPKQPFGFPLKQSMKLIRDGVLILIAFFLFFQGSTEALINNWTTTYLIDRFSVIQSKALYALSAFVAGMTIMRLLGGRILRTMAEKNLMYISFALSLTGLLLIKAGGGFTLAATGLFLTGTGLAVGFPVMLGLAGNRYPHLSGTAFSLVLSVSLIGNMLINYGMGFIASAFGIRFLSSAILVELAIMILIGITIFSKTKISGITSSLK